MGSLSTSFFKDKKQSVRCTLSAIALSTVVPMSFWMMPNAYRLLEPAKLRMSCLMLLSWMALLMR